jgi:hypothetical protein
MFWEKAENERRNRNNILCIEIVLINVSIDLE